MMAISERVKDLEHAAWRAGEVAEGRRFYARTGLVEARDRQKALIVALCRRNDKEIKKLFFKG